MTEERKRPETPLGRHMRPLREFLGLNQTRFGSLLNLSQPDVSIWDSPNKWDVALPSKIAKAFLDVWDCFPEPPVGGFNEMPAQQDIVRAKLSIWGLSIMFAVWMRAQRRNGDTAPRGRSERAGE